MVVEGFPIMKLKGCIFNENTVTAGTAVDRTFLQYCQITDTVGKQNLILQLQQFNLRTLILIGFNFSMKL